MFKEFIIPDDISDSIDQSNIFDNLYFNSVQKSLKAVLVTPICDLNWGIKYLNFCAVLPYESYILASICKKDELSKDEILEKVSSNGINNLIEGYKSLVKGDLTEIINNKLVSYHWLGEIPKNEGYWFIDYSLTNCIDSERIGELQRIAIIKSPLRESIFVRFSVCMGRVGLKGEQKDRDKYRNEIWEILLKS